METIYAAAPDKRQRRNSLVTGEGTRLISLSRSMVGLPVKGVYD